jgi:hypothetical protein
MEAKNPLSSSEMSPVSSGSSWGAAGVILMGIGFILASVLRIGVLAGYSGYHTLFQHLPEGFIQCRYLISWGMLVLGLVTGIGLFYRKDFFRKAGVLFVWISIVGVFGKHSLEGFVQYLRHLSESMAANGTPFSPASVVQFAQAWHIAWLTESALAWGCITLLTILEISFYFVIIFFLTRPSVKTLFR